MLESSRASEVQTRGEGRSGRTAAGLPPRRSSEFAVRRRQPRMQRKQHRATERQSCVREEAPTRNKEGRSGSDSSSDIATHVTLGLIQSFCLLITYD